MRANKKTEGLNKGYLFDGKKREYDAPLSSYPRTSFVRNSYFSLNGDWDFAVSKGETLPVTFSKKIQVPFPCEALDSGVNLLPEPDDILCYRRLILLPDEFVGKEILIHFDGIDYEAKVYIDRVLVKTHKGMNEGFTIHLSKDTPKRFEIIVQVKDPSDSKGQSRGKQALDPSYWTYTTTTGIYRPVWMECVPSHRLESVKFTPDFEKNKIVVHVNANCDGISKLHLLNKDYEVKNNVDTEIDIGEFHLWSAIDPYLYPVHLTMEEDEIDTYFAIRKVELKEVNGHQYLYLNGKPLFLSGLLYQGYCGYNNLTPASIDEYKEDLIKTKEMGFNCLRVHITRLCEAFYTLADQMGIYLIQDFPCGGEKRGLIPNCSPRVLNFMNCEKHVNYKWLGRENEKEREEFLYEGDLLLKELHNHPSILIYTIFNEGWGEFDPSKTYRRMKAQENQMLFDTASGWYEADESDFFSVHTYSFPKMKRKNRHNRCFILSEIGGLGLKYGESPYQIFCGHGKVKKKEQLSKKIDDLYENKIKPQIQRDGLCGVIYTQFADVETEYNGLYDLTREHCKVNVEKMKKHNQALYEEFEKHMKQGGK